MIYGYARVSTGGQSVMTQVAALTDAGAQKLAARIDVKINPVTLDISVSPVVLFNSSTGDTDSMEIVTVKTKFQIVIPQHIRERAHIKIGDLLEAGVEDGKITFTPKSLIDRHLAEGLEDIRKGRTHGPYDSAAAAIKALNARTQRPVKKKPGR